MTSPLEHELIRQITADGPLPLDRYMALALGHSEHGYYTGRDPFGRGGDFITAPEISQIFGELIGIWCAATWQLIGAPGKFNLVELGPGRGTLMADLVRAASVMPGFIEGAEIHLVEISPVLRDLQAKALKKCGIKTHWHDSIDALPEGKLIVIANEFFDALPVRHLLRSKSGWHERVVGLDNAQRLQLGAARDVMPENHLPSWAMVADIGEIAEISPARQLAATALAARIMHDKGAALIIDYGYNTPRPGDTLQAVAKHKPVDLLYKPGTADITAHVDFAALSGALHQAGLATDGPISQGQFLLAMGLRQREEVLKKRGDARQRMIISRAAMRLAAGNQMGELFKVITARHPDIPPSPPFGLADMEQP